MLSAITLMLSLVVHLQLKEHSGGSDRALKSALADQLSAVWLPAD